MVHPPPPSRCLVYTIQEFAVQQPMGKEFAWSVIRKPPNGNVVWNVILAGISVLVRSEKTRDSAVEVPDRVQCGDGAMDLRLDLTPFAGWT